MALRVPQNMLSSLNIALMSLYVLESSKTAQQTGCSIIKAFLKCSQSGCKDVLRLRKFSLLEVESISLSMEDRSNLNLSGPSTAIYGLFKIALQLSMYISWP